MLKRVTEALARHKVTVSVLKDSLDHQFQLQMAAASSFSRLVRTLAANVSPEQLGQAGTLTLLRGLPGAAPLPPSMRASRRRGGAGAAPTTPRSGARSSLADARAAGAGAGQ